MKRIKILGLLIVILCIINQSKSKEDFLILQEDENCSFAEIVHSGESENYPRMFGLVEESNGDRLIVRPIKKHMNKIIINLKKDYNLEEIEFFIIDKEKACIKRRVRGR